MMPSTSPARVGEVMQRRVVRRDGDAIERESEHRALLLEHADDRVGHALDLELAPEWIQIGEEVLRHFVTDYDYGRAQRGFLRSKCSPDTNIVLLDGEVVAVDRVRFNLLWTRPL